VFTYSYIIWSQVINTVKMLWKLEFANVPPGEGSARQRLELLHKKLAETTPAVPAEYAKTITDNVDKPYVDAKFQSSPCQLLLSA
jgi:hypothetical protein